MSFSDCNNTTAKVAHPDITALLRHGVRPSLSDCLHFFIVQLPSRFILLLWGEANIPSNSTDDSQQPLAVHTEVTASRVRMRSNKDRRLGISLQLSFLLCLVWFCQSPIQSRVTQPLSNTLSSDLAQGKESLVCQKQGWAPLGTQISCSLCEPSSCLHKPQRKYEEIKQ